MSAYSLLGSEVADVCSGDAQATALLRSAACAGAVFFDRAKVFGVTGMFEIEHTVGCNGVAKALQGKEASKPSAL